MCVVFCLLKRSAVTAWYGLLYPDLPVFVDKGSKERNVWTLRFVLLQSSLPNVNTLDVLQVALGV